MLTDAIKKLHVNKADKPAELGKDFEEVAAMAMLLFARSNLRFTLQQLCDPKHCGSDLGKMEYELQGGMVQLVKVKKFPANKLTITADDLQPHVDALEKDGASGQIIMMNDPYNAADIFALFRTTSLVFGFVCIRIQVKDWFLDNSKGNNIVVECRKYDKSCPSEVTLSSGVKIPVFSLFYMANPLEQDLACQPREGIVTIRSMRSWLPTAAHAIQSFSHLREVFSWDPEDRASRPID